MTQSWRSIDPVALPAGKSDTNPLGIAPIVNYLLGGGWYIGNGDMVIQYDWDEREFKIPLGIRIGRVRVKEKGSWNYYFEYQTSAVYEDWPGAAVENVDGVLLPGAKRAVLSKQIDHVVNSLQ